MGQAREFTDHVGRVLNVIEGRSHPRAPHPEHERLKQSWQRSLNKHSIDPGRASSPKVVTAYELREHRDRLETFMRIAREGVERLHHEVLPADYCVLLTDAQGVTVDFRTVPHLEQELKDEGFRNGTCWAEEHEGTCGVGTSLIDLQPTLVHRSEHFRAHNISFTCSSVPILGLEDEPIAVLDASALYSPERRESQLLVYRMVLDKARMIEDAYAHYSLRNHWILQLGPIAEFLPVETDYLIAFDDSGRIVGGNRRARNELIYAQRAARRISARTVRMHGQRHHGRCARQPRRALPAAHVRHGPSSVRRAARAARAHTAADRQQARRSGRRPERTARLPSSRAG
jgi:transcriptional regulator of acetoin/glycerol metabolism